MKIIQKLIYSSHRILGAILSIFFLMWFITGIVMIYHKYPHYTKESKLKHTPNLDLAETPSMDSISKLLSKNGIDTTKPFLLSLQNDILGKSFFTAKTSNQSVSFELNGDTLTTIKADLTYLKEIAKRWDNSKIIKIDTLNNLDQWTPFSRLRYNLPFYVVHLDGPEGRQLYVESKDGRIITEHTTKERFFAWIGAIPHWIYFTTIRQDINLWINLIIVISAIGCFMVLTGLYIGIEVYLKRKRKKGKFSSPYKKTEYKWHHVLGTISGVFIFAWIFSGMMSVINLPSWITGVPKDRDRFESVSQTIIPTDNKIDYRTLQINQIKGKKIEWSSFGTKPIIKVTTPTDTYVYDCSKAKPQKLYLTQNDIEETVITSLKSKPLSITIIDEYNGDYASSTKKRLPLPVYKVVMKDKYKTTIYIDPKTGNAKMFDKSSRIYNWMYKKPHTLSFNILTERPWLWTTLMWILLLCGTVVSATGVWISLIYIKRLWKNRK